MSTNTPHKFGGADARRLDQQYAAPTLVEQRRRTLEALQLQPGERVLDIGCGPGYLTLEMAQRVGPSGRVVGVDTAQPMLDVAAARCEGRPNVSFRLADAAALPFEDASMDAVAVVQVYLFVPDLARVFAELARVLKPGGRAVVVDTDWDSLVWHSSDPERMQRFIEVWKRRYADATVARLFPGCLRRAGLRIEHADAIAIVELAPEAASYSGSQLPEVAKYVGGKGGLPPEEARAWEADIRALAARGEYFFALNRYLFVARKPG
jgi:ubiquinone/menaquinone biosynthesis C-methylase UbiE